MAAVVEGLEEDGGVGREGSRASVEPVGETLNTSRRKGSGLITIAPAQLVGLFPSVSPLK